MPIPTAISTTAMPNRYQRMVDDRPPRSLRASWLRLPTTVSKLYEGREPSAALRSTRATVIDKERRPGCRGGGEPVPPARVTNSSVRPADSPLSQSPLPAPRPVRLWASRLGGVGPPWSPARLGVGSRPCSVRPFRRSVGRLLLSPSGFSWSGRRCRRRDSNPRPSPWQIKRAQLPYLHLCKLMQHYRQFRLTATHHD